MIGKVALLCLLALASVQCYPNDIQDIQARMSWSEIKEILNQFKTIIGEIKEKVVNKLADLMKTIENDIRNLDINKIIQQIKNAISSSVGEGAQVKDCIEKEEDVIIQLAQTYIDSIKQCATKAMSEVTALENQAKTLIQEAEDIITTSTSEGLKCFTNIHMIKCFTDLFNEVTGKFATIASDAGKLVSDTTLLIPKISGDLASCSANMMTEMQQGTQKIIADVMECAST